MRFSFTVTLLFSASFACATAPPTPLVDEAPGAPSVDPDSPDEQVHAPGGGGRPVELDYKDEREREALLGLHYGIGESGRATIDRQEAERILSSADLARPKERAAEEYEAGLGYYARNARLESIAAHTRAVLLDPENAGMYQGLGDALRAERFESRAEAAYRTGLDLQPSAGLHTRLAEILWMRAEREAAIAQAKLALALEPDDARARADLARWYYFTNDYSEAWHHVHRCEDLGVPLPSQFRPLLASRMPEPRR